MSRLQFSLMTGLAFITSNSLGADGPQKEIEALFTSFTGALNENNGPQATRLVTASSLKLMGQFRDAALYANADVVRKLPYGHRKGILCLRQLLNKDTLDKMDADALMPLCLEKEMIDPTWTYYLRVANVQVNGDKASAAVSAANPKAIQGALKTIQFQFRKENGQWRMELDPILKIEEALIVNFLKEHIPELNEGKDPDRLEELLNAAIKGRLELISKRELKPDIWKPLAPKK